MITYLDMPLPATSNVTGHDILIVAIVAGPPHNGDPKISLVYVDEDGSLSQADLSGVNVNWRYDNNRRKWVDVDTGEEIDGSEQD